MSTPLGFLPEEAHLAATSENAAILPEIRPDRRNRSRRISGTSSVGK